MDDTPQSFTPKLCPECGGERVSAHGGSYMSMTYKPPSNPSKFAWGGPDLDLNALV